MARYAIDAATLVQIVRSGVQIDPGHQLVAPNVVRTQALDLLLADVRAGALTDAEALELHERITTLKMRLLGDRVSRRFAWDLARQYQVMSLMQAEYIAVAKLQADSLITDEPDLARLAEGVVPRASIGDLTRP